MTPAPCDAVVLRGISTSFDALSPCERQVAHALLTRPPLESRKQASQIPARLACVRHAASVRPEPGSNSRVKSCIESRKCYLPSSKLISELTVFLDMTRENHVRVLLDSVSFSRIMPPSAALFRGASLVAT